MMKVRKLSLLLLLAFPLTISAQEDTNDFGLWTGFSAEKKLNKQWTVNAEAEYRLRDDWGSTDRWSVGLSVDYRIIKGLKASAGYEYIDDHEQKYTWHTDGTPNKYAKYWRPRHRVHVDLAGSLNAGRWKFTLRERWQYSYKPEKILEGRYDFDKDRNDGKQKIYGGKAANILRSRLKAEYNIRHTPLTPYAYAEIYNRWYLSRERVAAGLEWEINKHMQLDTYYLFQHNKDDDEGKPDTNQHIIGIQYTVKF